MGTGEDLPIEVVAALPEEQVLISLSVSSGTTARESVQLADVRSKLPGLDITGCSLAVWGKPVPDDHVLKANDRVEVLRPLIIDPRDARRQLATEGQVMGVLSSSADQGSAPSTD